MWRPYLIVGIDMKSNGDRILCTTKHTLNVLCLRKADWSALLTLLIALRYYKQSKNLNNLTCRGFSKFWNPAVFCLPACLPAVRPTSTRCRGPVFSHKIGDCCLNKNPLYWRTFTLNAIACPLVIHSIDWSSCLKQRCQNLTYHKHSIEGNM